MKTSHQYANELESFADEFAKLGERYNELSKIKAEFYKATAGEHKSYASFERAWDLTVEGQEMAEVKLKMKVKEVKSSAHKNMLRVLENEAKNII
jgi:hypothetical protein